MVSVSPSPHRKWVTANQQWVPSFPASVGKWDLICQITVKTTVIQTIPTTVTSCINHEGRGLVIWMALEQPISSQYYNTHAFFSFTCSSEETHWPEHEFDTRGARDALGVLPWQPKAIKFISHDLLFIFPPTPRLKERRIAMATLSNKLIT